MARSGWSTSNYLLLSSAVISATPLTIAAWFNGSVAGVSQRIVGIFNSASVSPALSTFYLGLNSSNSITAATGDGTAVSTATSSTTFTTSAWQHGAAVFASAISRSAYLNGGGKQTNTTSRIPSGLNRTAIGVEAGSAFANPFAPAGTGLIAEVGMWNIALSDADILSLSTGMSPLQMHPEALVGYWPLLGNNSPENNFKSNSATLTITGALSKAAHPRILMPRRRLVA